MKSLIFHVCVFVVVGLVGGETAAQDSAKPITAENANNIREESHVETRADRLIVGPNAGELVILNWNSGTEVLDESTLKSIRPLAKDLAPTNVAVSPDGKHMAWTTRNSSTYTVE